MATTKTIKKSAEKIIEDITYLSTSQSISRRVIYEYKNLKIKLELQSDGYKRQCYAQASALDGLEWKLIYFILLLQLSKAFVFFAPLLHRVENRTKSIANISQIIFNSRR